MTPRKGWAAVYCRLSKEDEDKTAAESESIRNQRELLLTWAADHGYRVYKVYTDEDYSGVDRARPGFNAMLVDAEQGRFALVPFKIRVGEREYVDLATLNTQQMLQAMTDYNGASTTACPSPEEWAEYFLQADNVFAFTISSNLSGSYNAAMAAREMVLEEHPEKKIFVLDTLSCAGALAGAAELANKLIAENQTFDDICFALKKFAESTHILFALASFDNLAKNGRVSKVVGFIAGRLNMRVLGRRTADGKIDFYFKTRGETRVLAKILEQMDEDGYDGVHPVLISECGNQTAAQLLHHGIEAKWPGAPVRIVPCAGLCAFYAQDQGIIITY